VATGAKRFEYTIGVDRAGQLSAEGGAPVLLDEGWSPDHVLLASVARCTIKSLRYHAERAGMDLVAEAETSGVVTKREEDGRYAFAEIDCRIDVELEPAPSGDEALRELLGKAERDCFVGASLRVEPRYRWRVNGKDLTVS
jgi:uncharacterized OsmC-like protein